MAMTLVVGLGNPGTSYAGNRHNIGFMAIDAIASHYGFSKAASKFGGLACEGNIGGDKVIAFKPMGYMNTSGGPVGEASRFYKIPPENIIVIHDELDLELGRLRVKLGGGHGGHNGLKSIDAHIGKEYWRVRLGIGHPGDKDLVSPYVLSDFRKEERSHAQQMISEVSRHLPLLLQGDEAGFMNKVVVTTQNTSTKEV
jgi:PTH1 family peptidyl-tRNA hydrolase